MNKPLSIEEGEIVLKALGLSFHEIQKARDHAHSINTELVEIHVAQIDLTVFGAKIIVDPRIAIPQYFMKANRGETRDQVQEQDHSAVESHPPELVDEDAASVNPWNP